MKFYTKNHPYYCGIDLHTKNLYVCILDQEGTIVVHKNIKAHPQALMGLIKPFLPDLVIGVECMFSWYGVADFCEDQGIDFVLGHALYMRAIHGGKAKNDKIDLHKIATLLRGGMFPLAYVYPRPMRRRLSYCRLIKCKKESAGKSYGTTGKRSAMPTSNGPEVEAAVLFLRQNPDAQAWLERLVHKHNKARALTLLVHQLARAVYFMLKRKTVFDQKRFLNASMAGVQAA